MLEKQDDRPLSVKLAGWYGFIFAAVFLVYGGVEIILSFLDRNYAALVQPIIFTIFGLILISFAYAFKELRTWGWHGLIVINAVVVIVGLIGYKHYENIILAVLSGIALVVLFMRSTKEYLFRHQ